MVQTLYRTTGDPTSSSMLHQLTGADNSLLDRPRSPKLADFVQPTNDRYRRPQKRLEHFGGYEVTQNSHVTKTPSPTAVESRIVLLNLLQMCDSTFPISGFTHSGGIEAAWRRGAVPSYENLQRLLKTCILATCSQQIPYVVAAYTTVAASATDDAFSDSHDSGCQLQLDDTSVEDPMTPKWALQLVDLDRMLSVSLSNHVARRASLQQGRSLLSLAVEVFPSAAPLSRLSTLRSNGPTNSSTPQESGGTHSVENDLDQKPVFEGHLAVVFGAVCALLGAQRSETLDTFAFSALRNFVSAAVRLGRIGSFQAQKLQNGLSEFCVRTAERYSREGCGEGDHQSAPILDVYQNSQDRLFTKMFYS